MVKFKKGDRVRVICIQKLDIEKDIQVGDTGTALENDTTPYIRMDKYSPKLFNAGGLCEDGHGWFFEKDQLELIEAAKPTTPTLTTQELYALHGAIATLPDWASEMLMRVLDTVKVIDANKTK